MSAPDAMRLALMEPDAYGQHCADSRTNRRGRVVATCTGPNGHDGPHTDAHAGHTWPA